MRWPWISRIAYDDLRSDRDHWRTLVFSQSDQLMRLERKAAGMPETPPQPKQRIEADADIIQAAFNWPDGPAKLRRAEADLNRGMSRDEVLLSLKPSDEET